ncbi:RloB family protein [Flavobacterium sp. B183]|uniref:RloB family protein n=1 Tax=Flavobacterium sp. B183 TaxID=907046 RepID=UPI00201E8373|nr:RloB family protein [Flavobacterium sp. B183]URC14813.1 RloB family protein [Flavobacterium sp. B183]
MPQDYRKTILIVCEGQRSEPDYFHNLRNEVLSEHSDVFIKILPIPKDEQKAIEKDLEDFIVRTGAKRRQIKKALNNSEPEDYLVENEFKAQPTCYVRRAQLAYLEKGYSELWAVYDKDGHPDHERAYALSLDKGLCDKTVNIGFSSISFEEWILMHFEYCDIEFLKSQCRDSGKNTFDCGSGAHELDCNGEKCIVGRIVKKQYLGYSDSKNFEYNGYAPGVERAFFNALTSRDVAIDKEMFFNNNPYVSLDRLVFKLKNIKAGDLIWIYNNVLEIETGIFVKISNIDGVTSIIFYNQSPKTFIVKEGFLKLIMLDFRVVFFNGRKILNPNESYSIYSKQNVELNDFHYALFNTGEAECQIIDVVQIKNFR